MSDNTGTSPSVTRTTYPLFPRPPVGVVTLSPQGEYVLGWDDPHDSFNHFSLCQLPVPPTPFSVEVTSRSTRPRVTSELCEEG